jgi:hypothetical protein
MKIITTSYEDFIKSEIKEHGFDYVEAQFLMGYEPAFTNGVWLWAGDKANAIPLHINLGNRHNTSNSVSSSGGRVLARITGKSGL